MAIFKKLKKYAQERRVQIVCQSRNKACIYFLCSTSPRRIKSESARPGLWIKSVFNKKFFKLAAVFFINGIAGKRFTFFAHMFSKGGKMMIDKRQKMGGNIVLRIRLPPFLPIFLHSIRRC